MLFKPGVGRGNHQQAAGADARVNGIEEFRRIIEAIDEVGGEHQIIIRQCRFEIAGIALHKLRHRHFIQPQLDEAARLVERQLAFIDQRITQHAFACQLHAQIDEARGEIDAGHRIKMTRQFEAGTAGGTTQIQRPLAAAPFKPGQQFFHQRLGKVGHTKIAVAIVKLGILAQQLIGLIMGRWHLMLRLAGDVTETGMLEEMTPESIARRQLRLIATGRPGAALDQVVLTVKGGQGEVVIERMHLETIEGINGRFRPLPDIAHHIVKITLSKTIHGAGGGKVIQMQVGRPAAIRVVGWQSRLLLQQVPFIFARQTDGQPRLARLPVTKGLGFEIVHLHRPVPRHGHFFAHQTQVPTRRLLAPELGRTTLAETAPLPALITPVVTIAIAACLDKFQILAIADQILGGLESRHLCLMAAVFIIPAIEGRVALLAETHLSCRHRQQGIDRRLVGVATGCPVRQRFDPFQPLLADQH